MKSLIIFSIFVGLALASVVPKQPRSPVGDCPEKDPANPVYLPDSEDCTLYYECSNGVAVLNNCPPDMEFNPTLHVCTEPLDSGCKATGDTSSTSPTTSSPTTTAAPTTSS